MVLVMIMMIKAEGKEAGDRLSPFSFTNHRGQRTDLATKPQIRGWPITQKL